MPPQRRRIDELQGSLWKENKTTLRRLYLEERKTLKDVKKAMESEYGFPVTPLSTYESKLRELGLRKKMKRADWHPVYQHYVHSGNRHTAIYFNGTQIPWDKAWKEIRRSGARESIDRHATELPVDVVMRSPSPVLGVRSATSLRYMMPVPWRLSDVSLEALIPATVDYRAHLYEIPSNLLRMAMLNNSQQFFTTASIETGLIHQSSTLFQRDLEHTGLISDIDRLSSALYRLANDNMYLTAPGKPLYEAVEAVLNLTPKRVLLKILASNSPIIRAALETLVGISARLGRKEDFASLIEITWRLHPEWTFGVDYLKFAGHFGCIDSCRILLQMLRRPTSYLYSIHLACYLDATLLSIAERHIDCAKFLVWHAMEPNTTLQRLEKGFAHMLFCAFLDKVSTGFYHPFEGRRCILGLDNPTVLQVLDWFLEGGANVDLPVNLGRPSWFRSARHTFRNWMPTVLDFVYFQDAGLYPLLVDHSVKFKTEPTRSGIHHSASEGIEHLRIYLLSCVSHTPAEQDALVDIVLTEEFSRDEDINFDVICNLFDYNLGLQASRFDLNISAMLFYVIKKAKQQGRVQGMHPAVPHIVKTLTQGGAIIVDETIRAAVDREGTTFLQLLSHHGADFKNQGALALCSAARFGNYNAVNWLLDKGVGINTTFRDELTERESGKQGKITIIAQASIVWPYNKRCTKIFDHQIWAHEMMPTISYGMFKYLVYRGAKLGVTPTDTSPRQLLCLVIRNGGGEDNWESLFAKIKLILNAEPLRDDELRVDRCPLEACFWGAFFRNRLGTLPQKLLILDYLLKCGILARHSCVLPYLLLLGAPRSEIEKMLNSSADLNAYCGRWSHSSNIRIFIQHWQRTPIQAAAEVGSLDWVQTLIQRGADVNSPAKGIWGRTALQAACEANCDSPEGRVNHINLIKFLIANSANVNAPPASSYGITAFQCAAAKGDFEVALLLLDNGADINALPSNYGFCALDGAVHGGRTDMVQFLLNLGAVSHPKGESGYREAIRLGENRAIADLIRQYALKNGKSGEELSAD